MQLCLASVFLLAAWLNPLSLACYSNSLQTHGSCRRKRDLGDRPPAVAQPRAVSLPTYQIVAVYFSTP